LASTYAVDSASVSQATSRGDHALRRGILEGTGPNVPPPGPPSWSQPAALGINLVATVGIGWNWLQSRNHCTGFRGQAAYLATTSPRGKTGPGTGRQFASWSRASPDTRLLIGANSNSAEPRRRCLYSPAKINICPSGIRARLHLGIGRSRMVKRCVECDSGPSGDDNAANRTTSDGGRAVASANAELVSASRIVKSQRHHLRSFSLPTF
jgi:hypothetical protein